MTSECPSDGHAFELQDDTVPVLTCRRCGQRRNYFSFEVLPPNADTVPFDYGDGTDRPNYAPNADSRALITAHGFRWIGQSWQTCDECGKPADQHSGIDEPCREHLFCKCPSTIKPWKQVPPTDSYGAPGAE